MTDETTLKNAYALLLGDEDADELAGLQELVDSGLAWQLEGSVGRACMAAIEAGRIALGPEGRRDYYGNYVPGRDEVEPGTKGSVEYVREHDGRVPEK
jgi:hypothetical protein